MGDESVHVEVELADSIPPGQSGAQTITIRNYLPLTASVQVSAMADSADLTYRSGQQAWKESLQVGPNRRGVAGVKKSPMISNTPTQEPARARHRTRWN